MNSKVMHLQILIDLTFLKCHFVTVNFFCLNDDKSNRIEWICIEILTYLSNPCSKFSIAHTKRKQTKQLDCILFFVEKAVNSNTHTFLWARKCCLRTEKPNKKKKLLEIEEKKKWKTLTKKYRIFSWVKI